MGWGAWVVGRREEGREGKREQWVGMGKGGGEGRGGIGESKGMVEDGWRDSRARMKQNAGVADRQRLSTC